MESVFLFLESNTMLISGFLMSGVILVLIGVKNVTYKELAESSHAFGKDKKRVIDELVGWGVFYIIFGVLILTGIMVTYIGL